jgi:hypothetical protein
MRDDTVDLIPGALDKVLHDAQRHAGIEPNLTRTRIARLFHERLGLERNERRGTYGTRRRIGGTQVPVWPIPLAVIFSDASDDSADVLVEPKVDFVGAAAAADGEDAAPRTQRIKCLQCGLQKGAPTGPAGHDALHSWAQQHAEQTGHTRFDRPWK